MWRWAFERSEHRNAHFVHGNEIAWTPEDFMGTSNRKERAAKSALERMQVAKANAELGKMSKHGPIPDDVPAWARPN